jgi:transposase
MREVDCENCQIVKMLLEKIKELEARIVELERRLMLYENPHTPPSRTIGKYPPKKSSSGKPGQKKGHKGVTRLQPKPSEHFEAKMKLCPDCGKHLGKPVRVERKIVEEIPEPMPVKVIEYLYYYYHCENCNKEFTAKHPDMPKEGRFGKNILVETTLMKYEERLPLRKIQAVLKRQYGLNVSVGAIFDFTRRVHESLQTEYSLILQRIRNSKITYVDETSIKVNGKKYWIWIFVTPFDIFT